MDFHINKGGRVLSLKEVEAMARRQYQEPTPYIRGKWWVIEYRVAVMVDGQVVRVKKKEKLARKEKKIREVLKIRDEFMRPYNQGINNARSATTFDEYIRQVYRGTKIPLMSKPSRDRYEGVIDNYLLPAFGAKMLRELTPETLQSYMTGIIAGGKLKLESRRKIATVLSSILGSAKKYGYLTANPAESLELGRATAAPKKPFITPQQFNLLVDLIPEPYATMVYVAVYTGLRVSELVALRWRNLGPDSITVEERCCRGDWSAPKSAASAATIGVNADVLARIESLKNLTVEVKAGRAVRKIKAVKSAEPDVLIFQPLMGGEQMRDNNILSRHIKPAARKLKLDFVNWRCLRTSHATWLIMAGASVKDTQGQMRHSTARPTMDIYAQFVPETQRKAVDKLSQLATERIQ